MLYGSSAKTTLEICLNYITCSQWYKSKSHIINICPAKLPCLPLKRDLSRTIWMRLSSLQLFAFCSKCYSFSVPSSLCLSPTSTSPQSETLQINPLHTLIPSTMCVSFGVMLPVGNPPNAIVFSYGHVQISDMVRHMHTQIVTWTFCTCGIKGRASVGVDLCNQNQDFFF